MEVENAANPFKMKREDIQSFINTHTKVYVSEGMDIEVRKMAAKIMKSGVKLMDACHIACAILARCQIFISTDKRLLKYQTDEIRIMNPAIFIIEQEGEK